jgi:Tfp pilus assembly protein PilN
VKAVNLIPSDIRRGGGAGALGRSGGAVYVLLGGLAALVAMASAYGMMGRSLGEKRAELRRLNAETATAQAKAGSFASTNRYAQLRQTRVQTVGSLARSRFDWAHALHDLAVTIPRDVWLTSLTASVAPGVSVGNGADDPLRGALPLPAMSLVGCTTSQARVATLMTELRAMDRVVRVSLSDSSKAEADGAGGGSGGGGGGDCRGSSTGRPKFSMVVFYEASPGAVGPGSAGGGASSNASAVAAAAGSGGSGR